MKKRFFLIVLCLIALTGLAACGKSDRGDDGRLKVLVSFNALKEFALAVGQDRVDVSTIIPDGTEPHAFEPTARDLAGLGTADVFVYNGLGMEPWAEKAVSAAENESLVVVNASDGAEPIVSGDAEAAGEYGQYDPHLWLSPKAAEIEVINIKNALVGADPDNAELYEKNCAEYVAQLESLYAEYSAKFAGLSERRFVTGHAAFAYLCRDFGLEQQSVEDIFATGEPSMQKLAELVDYCREHGITTVFAEELASPEISRTLAEEVGAQIKTIFTMAGSEDGRSFLERMSSNLAVIYESLAS
jgi:zinc transport system substrate-binding protein